MTQRAINVDQLSDEAIETAIDKISNKINADVDATCARVNELLKRYGMACKMQIVIEKLETSETTHQHDKIEQEVLSNS